MNNICKIVRLSATQTVKFHGTDNRFSVVYSGPSRVEKYVIVVSWVNSPTLSFSVNLYFTSEKYWHVYTVPYSPFIVWFVRWLVVLFEWRSLRVKYKWFTKSETFQYKKERCFWTYSKTYDLIPINYFFTLRPVLVLMYLFIEKARTPKRTRHGGPSFRYESSYDKF